MKKILQKIGAGAAIVPLLALAIVSIAPARAAEGDVCSTITLVSGASTQTAGWTEINTGAPPVAPLNPSLYSGASFSAAVATETVIPPWVDPSVEANLSGATWMSSGASWPGGSGNTEGSPTNDQWRLFQHGFDLPAGATVSSAQLWFSADNAASVYLNGGPDPIASTQSGAAEVYGTSTSGFANFSVVSNTSFSPMAGSNALSFVVRNWADASATTNPTGLIYKAVVDYCVPAVEDTVVKVTIVKYVNGEMATAASAASASFAMSATWDAENIGSGSGSFSLSPAGYNSPDPYHAVTADMSAGADYSTNEVMDSTTDATCEAGRPFALLGYTSGNTLAEAEAGTPSLTAPSFTGLEDDKYVIVWNRDCATPYTIKVRVLKHLNGLEATASSSNSYLFPISATWQAANLNGGAETTGSFSLGNNFGGASALYGADSAAMEAGASYSLSEVTTGTSTQVVATSTDCAPGKYLLQGYRTSSLSFADAAAASLQQTAPAFTNLQSDRWVIVDNASCPAEPGQGSLEVTGVDVLDGNGIANGTYEDGWKYVFHITIPDDEQNVAMKFSDWSNNSTSSPGSIAVANNMRISSAQADNSGATVTLSAADTYSSPDLHITGDMSTSTPGRQVDVTVEVKIPSGTANGSYTTSYGLRSLP